MPTYRIKKGKRVFKAAKLATITELVSRGLLVGDDRVSVDGGPFQRIRELDGVEEALAAQSREELRAPSTPKKEDGGDGVLAAFLSEVEDAKIGSTTGSMPALSPEPRPPRRSSPGRPRPDASVVGTLEHEPEPLAEPLIEPISEPLPEIAGGSLEELPDEPPFASSGTLHSSFESDFEAPSSAPDTLFQDEKFRRAQARLGAMAAGAGAPAAPVSFADWMANREDGGEALLENFGVDDPLIALQQARPVEKGFSVLRLFLIIAAGLIFVGGYYTWIRTGATTQFPVESSLTKGHAKQPTRTPPKSPPAVSRSPTRTPPPSAPMQEAAAVAQDARLRAEVGDSTLEFNDRDELESALFLELQNLGCRPRSVKAKVLADRNRRPTEVDLLIVQAPVPEGMNQTAEIRERLGLTWMLVGKYGRLGKVTSRNVKVDLAGQLLTERSGDRLVQLHKGATTSADIFLKE